MRPRLRITVELPLGSLNHVAHRLVDVGVDRSDKEGLLFAGEAVQVENLHLFRDSAFTRFSSTKKEKSEWEASLLVLGKLGLDILVGLQCVLVKLSPLTASNFLIC
jgi:hypothetical protein